MPAPQIPEYMNYWVYFKDLTEYTTALALAGGANPIIITPRSAASTFGIPFPYPTGPLGTNDKGIAFMNPFIPGHVVSFPNGQTFTVDDTLNGFLVPGQQGNPVSVFPPGPDEVFFWSATILFLPPPAPAGSPVISQRRFIAGHDINYLGEDNGQNSVIHNRDSSRALDGVGISIRGQGSLGWSHNVNSLRAITTNVSWERFYIRVRRVGSQDYGIWRCHNDINPNAGFALKVMSTGQVHGFAINSVNVQVDKGTVFTPTVGTWYRVDAFLRFQNANGVIHIFINGVDTYTNTDTTGAGLGINGNHASSELGLWAATSENDMEIDLDDWINADLPYNFSSVTMDFTDTNFAPDWNYGSHVRVHYSLSASLGAFGGNGGLGTLNQNFSYDSAPTSSIASTTALDTIDATTDAASNDVSVSAPDGNAMIDGAVAAIVALYSVNSAGTDGRLGYKIGTGSPVLTTVNQLNVASFTRVGYLPTGLNEPITDITPWHIMHEKSNDANSDTVTNLLTIVEYLTIYGKEDNTNFNLPLSRITNFHNCRYPDIQYGNVSTPVQAPVYAIGGTYTGNGNYQEISLPAPCHFLWIRNVTAGTSGARLFGAALSAHTAAGQADTPVVRLFNDASHNTKFSVSGNNAGTNQAGVTYQYIAFCDPGSRYNLCGGFAHRNGSIAPFSNVLIDPAFSPDAGFAQVDTNRNTTITVGMWYKGAGHPGSQGSTLTGGAVLSNFGTFGAGIFSSDSGLHTGTLVVPVTYSLWRLQDPNATSNVMVQICTYTGNGSNPRTINLTPVSNRSPIFVLVVPVAAAASFFRDPSHSGNNSSDADTYANSTTAITGAGIDTIQVNSALNSNGVVYSIFAIPGDTTSSPSNGTYYASNSQPVVNSAQILPATVISGDIVVITSGGLELGASDAITLLKDYSGIYTLIPGQRHDTLYDRQTNQTSLNVKIPNPHFETGYAGG